MRNEQECWINEKGNSVIKTLTLHRLNIYHRCLPLIYVGDCQRLCISLQDKCTRVLRNCYVLPMLVLQARSLLCTTGICGFRDQHCRLVYLFSSNYPPPPSFVVEKIGAIVCRYWYSSWSAPSCSLHWQSWISLLEVTFYDRSLSNRVFPSSIPYFLVVMCMGSFRGYFLHGREEELQIHLCKWFYKVQIVWIQEDIKIGNHG